MKKYNLSKIMKRAWEIKKECEDNLFSACLHMAWVEEKAKRMQGVLEGLGFRVWQGGNHRRIYIDGIQGFKKIGLEKHTENYPAFRIAQMYYDMNAAEFILNWKAKGVGYIVKRMIADLQNIA